MSSSNQRGRGGGVQASAPASTDPGKKCTIHWEGVRGAHTEHLLAWCKENEDAHVKLFSAKDAKEQGWKKKQSGTSRDIFYSQVAQAVFSNDEDLEYLVPVSFIPPLESLIRCFRLKRKYNKFNKELKQSGAGKTYAELQEDPKMKSLINTKLEKFPWWPELHGWWRMNPAFNHAFSTADAGQDFASAALEHFNVSKQSQPLATCDDDTHTDDDPEDIVELGDGAMDGAGIVDGADDMMVDQSPHME
ncbi:hypothetical protein EDB19DRAFT_1978151 [Suillus lakei]|nr:hypothetical protein EDB19DRAFT_1978151 [Suillus lakei]